MPARQDQREERIEIDDDYAVCAWARHFNVPQRRVKEAVAAVGDKAERVREHLLGSASERPAGH